MPNSKSNFVVFLSHSSDSETQSYLRKLRLLLNELLSLDETSNIFSEARNRLYLFEADALFSNLTDYISGNVWFAPTELKEAACQRLGVAMLPVIFEDVRSRPDSRRDAVRFECPFVPRTELGCKVFADTSDKPRNELQSSLSRISKSGRLLRSTSNVLSTSIFLVKEEGCVNNSILRIDLCKTERSSDAILARERRLLDFCDGHRTILVGDLTASLCLFNLVDRPERAVDTFQQEAPFSWKSARDIYFGIPIENSEMPDACRENAASIKEDGARLGRGASNDASRFSFQKARDLFFGITRPEDAYPRC